MSALHSRLREFRQRAGLTQRQLADRAAVTRQTVGGIESGAYGPGVEVGLRLARVLGCRVDDLFQLEESAADTVAVAAGPPASPTTRVALADIAGRTVARRLHGLGALRWAATAAHGFAAAAPAPGAPVRVRPLPGARRGLFLAGCDPALGLLAAHAGRAPHAPDALWWQAGNAAAVAQLAGGEVHAAAVHGPEGEPAPRAPFALARFRLARWEMGWMVRRGNPKSILSAGDLARPGVTLANREAGAGARALLDRQLAGAGISADRVAGYVRELPGHDEVAAAVALGSADVALGIAAAARERGLDFLPLTAEVCDLWLRRDALDDPGLAALLEALPSASFRADLAEFGPYDTADTGKRIA